MSAATKLHREKVTFLEIRLLKDKLEVGEEARKRVQADFETTPHRR